MLSILGDSAFHLRLTFLLVNTLNFEYIFSPDRRNGKKFSLFQFRGNSHLHIFTPFFLRDKTRSFFCYPSSSNLNCVLKLPVNAKILLLLWFNFVFLFISPLLRFCSPLISPLQGGGRGEQKFKIKTGELCAASNSKFRILFVSSSRISSRASPHFSPKHAMMLKPTYSAG